MLKDLRRVLGKTIDPEMFLRPAARSIPLNEQIEEACFWFCVSALFLLISFQAWASFRFNAERGLGDYGSLYASASLANVHANPYGNHPLVFVVRDFNRHASDSPLQGSTVSAINLNPPVVLYPFRLLSRLNPQASFVTWSCISAVLFVLSTVLILHMYPDKERKIRVLWILGMGGVWYTFQLGQIYTILLLLTTAAWLSLWKRKWVAAGIFIGAVCAVKPNFLVWPVLLVVGRSRKAGYAAIARQ